MAIASPQMSDALLAALFARAMRRAGDALREMSGQVISVSTPNVRRCTARDVIELAGGAEPIVVGIYVGITGALTGHALLILPVSGARRLAHLLLEGMVEADAPLNDPTGNLVFDPMEVSALQELGNVTVGAFLNECGMHLHEGAFPTVPQALVEFAGAILDSVLLDLSDGDGTMLAARTLFVEGDRQVDGTLLVLPRPESLQALLEAVEAGA